MAGDAISRRYDMLRSRATSEAQSQTQEEQDAIRRRMAAQGMLNSGTAVKQQTLASERGAQRAQAASQNVDIAEMAERAQREEADINRQFTAGESQKGRDFSSAEAEKGRGFAKGERLGSQEFSAGQADIGRKFATGERLGSQEFAAGQSALGRQFATQERLGGQEFASAEAGKGREFARGERLGTQEFQAGQQESAQRFAAGESQKARDLQEILTDAQRRVQKDALDLDRQKLEMSASAQAFEQSKWGQQYDIALRQMGLEERVSQANLDMQESVMNQKNILDRLGDFGTQGWKAFTQPGGTSSKVFI